MASIHTKKFNVENIPGIKQYIIHIQIFLTPKNVFKVPFF